MKRILMFMALTCLICQTVEADMTFSTVFTAQAQSDLSAAEQAMFQDAVTFWDDIIIDHRDLGSRNWELTVDTFSQAASGGGVLLGSAGPSSLAFSGVVAGAETSNERFILSTSGAADFNVHPDAGALSLDTLKHEIGHALGIGTLWEDNEVYNDGVAGNHNRTRAGSNPGEYLGSAALAAWRAEFTGPGAGPGAAFVPVELAGGAGTAHGHWNENDNFGQGLTGITDAQGRDMRDELMTGWGSSNPDFLSNTTRQSMFDIGFLVNPASVPEPGSTTLLFIGSTMLLAYRRRQQ